MLSTHVEIMESLGRLGVALALGSVIGFERTYARRGPHRADLQHISSTTTHPQRSAKRTTHIQL